MPAVRPNLALMGFAAMASANVLVLGFATVVLRIALGRELAKFGVDSPDRIWIEGGSLGIVERQHCRVRRKACLQHGRERPRHGRCDILAHPNPVGRYQWPGLAIGLGAQP